MGHASGATSGVLHRTFSLFNCKTFSDVEFHVRDAEEYKVFYAHKLILSMAGEGFARLFYEKSPATKSVKIVDFTPHIFNMMLQYLYCDKLNISNVEDAIDLLKIGKKYIIYDLIEKCDAYISDFEVDIDSVLVKYESAVSNQFRPSELLKICRKFVAQNTKDVFESPKFCNVSLSVVQDIVNINDLSVSSEMEVLKAAIRWGHAECKRLNLPPDLSASLRAVILPLFKHIRFLCLDIQEFFYFVDEYDCLLSKEYTKLTARILDKENTSLIIPQEFCSICTPRIGLNIAPINGHSQSIAPSCSIETNHSVPRSSYSPYKSEANVSVSNIRQNSPKTIAAPVQSAISQYKPQIPQPTSPNSPPLYQLVPPKKNTPVLKVIPQTKPKMIMAYEFPLREMQKEIASAFENDVKCNAAITMLRGTVLIHGIELRVKDLKTPVNEQIEVHLCLSNKLGHKSNSNAVQLKNNTLELSLGESYKVTPSNPLDVEVTIEDLKLNRCSVCRLEESTFELNCGLGVTAKIYVNSNQSNGTDSFFFLISKIIYSVPS